MTENYNETVLIPILEKRVHDLTSAGIMAEAKLQIAMKEKEQLEKQVSSLKAQLVAEEVPVEVFPQSTK